MNCSPPTPNLPTPEKNAYVFERRVDYPEPAGRAVMTQADEPLTVEQVARHFHRACRANVRELLETLAALEHMEETEEGSYAT